GGASWLRGIIENNVIVQNNTECSGTCGTDGIVLPDTTRGTNDQAQTGVLVRNNSVYIGAQLGANGRGIVIGGEGTSYVSANNTIYFAGTDSSWNCFDYGLSAGAYNFIDYNNCFRPNA